MEELYHEHARMIYGFLLAKCGDADLAEELTQETFYQALRSLDRYRGDSRVSTWLCGIANNVWRRWLQKQRRTKEDLSLDNAAAVKSLRESTPTQESAGPSGAADSLQTPSAESVCLARLDTLSLLQALHRLQEPMREVLYLRLMGELSFKEIGQIMERSENWARVTYYREKEKLQKGVSIK